MQPIPHNGFSLHPTDTIVAISTPPGRGGIGIVRLSGPDARAIATPLLRLRTPLAPSRARFAQILDLDSDPTEATVLDEAIVTFYAAPHSYTTEDIVEIACHGAPVLLEALLRACLAHGARLAEPGEFTQRAFLAGRLDLTQAEAVHDLIAANTLHQARVAAAQLGGSLSRAVNPIKQELIALIAQLEAGVDFAEDDLDLLPQTEILARIGQILPQLNALAATCTYGRIVREGFTLAIVGRPNAGKSSLFNRLLARDRAIVTAQPGTTRDPIAETLSLDGIPVRLVDTAGLRAAPIGPDGEAERQGIARTSAEMAEADLVLQVLDASTLPPEGLTPEDTQTLAQIAARPHLLVLNKSDLLPPGFTTPPNLLLTSAHTGQGIEALRAAIVQTLTQAAPSAETALVTNLRQQRSVQSAVAALQQAQYAAVTHLPHELLLLDLYAALEALDQLTGTTTPHDILNLIFSTFCIGK
jgi:tRNA modification GTPase